jgi:hypothetical protein
MNKTDEVTKAAIRDYIGQADSRELYKMLKFLYDRQTNLEKFVQDTSLRNAVGFNSNDAQLLSGICETAPPFRSLTPRQANVVRRRINKYWRQLVDYLSQIPEHDE